MRYRVYRTDNAGEMAMLAYDFRRQHQLSGNDKLTLAAVRGCVTAQQVAKQLGIAHSAACNRLRKLTERGHLKYEYRNIEGGGREHVYWKSESVLHMQALQPRTRDE